MGTLVFQATLGGAINLIGPNTASTVNFTLPSADGTSGQALSTNGSGTLAFGTLAVGAGGTGQTSYTNGQLLIGNTTGNTLTKATLTAGTGVSITNGTGSITIAATGGGGDVFGPASSTDNAFTRFDSTTGKLLQNSTGATLSDTGAAVFTGALDVLGNSTAGSNIKLYEDTDNGTNYVAFKAPDTIAANVTWTLPAADGTSAQVLSTNGSGTLSWATAGGGGSAATPTALGTVYASMSTSGAAPYLTAVGYLAGNSNQSGGIANSAFGWGALNSNTTGIDNVSIGMQTMNVSTTGSANTAVGKKVLQANSTASNNTGVGFEALNSNTTGASNTSAGKQALYYVTTGSNNIGIGVNAGESLTTGSSNIYIGSGTVYASSASVSNAINISAYTLQSDKGSQTALIFANSGAGAGGSYYNGANSSSWNTTSDQRIKKNIVDNNDGLNKINSIRVRNFEYRLPEEVDSELKPSDAIIKSGVQLGVIAQELQAVLPECVKQETTGVLSVDSDNLTWYMINAIKELKAEIDKLKGNV
jgi:hypothetical protein